MEHIYSMRRKPLKCEPPNLVSSSLDSEVSGPIVTISNSNIIAFSSLTELSDEEGDTWGGHVYVCDLDTPWYSHKVTSTTYPIATLEWDEGGKLLLVGTTVGDVTVYGQKEYLLNEWTALCTTTFPGEHIKKATFFLSGRRIVPVDKKADAPITERFQMMRVTPTMKGFGGLGAPGVCVVTATGLVGCLIPDGPKALTATEALRPQRDHVSIATITHKNGSMLIAAACRTQHKYVVRTYLCSVERPRARIAPRFTLQTLPAFHLTTTPASLAWCVGEECDALLVAAGPALALWKCTERPHPIHKLLYKPSGNTTPGGGQKPGSDTFNTLTWTRAAVWQPEGAERGVCVAAPRLPLAPPLAVLCTPRRAHLLALTSPHILNSKQVIPNGGQGPTEAPSGAATPPKKSKYGPGVTSTEGSALVCGAEVSALGGVLVLVDTQAQLHVYKLPQPWTEPLMQYWMVRGGDGTDLLLSSAAPDAAVEALSDMLHRYPQHFQQYCYHRWLNMRIALCRTNPHQQVSVSTLTTLQMLHSIWAACSLALRVDERTDPALSAILDPHDDKSLAVVESKTELIPETLCLAPLRASLQRAVDVAVTALLALPASAHHHQHQCEVWSEASGVALLRRLVVVARAHLRTDALSRPLARLAAAPHKPDLLEECSALGAQYAGPRVWDNLPRCCVSAPHAAPRPHRFDYGVEPKALRFSPEPPPYAQSETTPSITMDAIRYMHLGGGARHALHRAFDARFMPACRCGGKWTLKSYI